MRALELRPQVNAELAPGGLKELIEEQNMYLASMAGMLKAACAKIDELERQVRMMERITPTQAAALNALVRLRSRELCREYRAPGCEKAVNALIRSAIRARWGVTVKELPRVELNLCTEFVRMWENSDRLFALREKAAAKE